VKIQTISAAPDVTLRQECVWVGCAAAVLSFLALAYCMRHGMLLLFGDAVAHLHIARRLGDSLYPGFRQLGSVWLPLPHLLTYPFAQSMHLWQTGLAGSPPSMIAYILAVAGLYRLTRLALPPSLSLLAVVMFALNPGLLYMQTTAMTEPIFLVEMIWGAIFVTQHGIATTWEKSEDRDRVMRRALVGATLVLLAAVYTRYDGWIYAALAWCILAYNAKQFGDPLDFIRGPYSARAIDLRTSAHGPGHYPGWHRLPIALMYFLKAGELNVTTYWLTDLSLVGALAGTFFAIRAKRGMLAPMLLFWLPVPFYTYSISYGSVPLFLPQWYPHGWYNTRYGMEMLPVFALSYAWLAAAGVSWLRRRRERSIPAFLVTLAALFAINNYGLMRERPLVLGEAVVNSQTRIPFEQALAHELESLPPSGLILMNTSDHVGALQDAGIPLRRTINDGDWLLWKDALAAPAQSARFAVALDKDDVAAAVKAHPEGLRLLDIICSTGQPCARVYESTVRRRF
jgi:hypothetical protein